MTFWTHTHQKTHLKKALIIIKAVNWKITTWSYS